MAAAWAAAVAWAAAQRGSARGWPLQQRQPLYRSTEAPASAQSRASQVNDKLYDLRSRLQLTPEQGKLWDTLTDEFWDMSMHAGPARVAAVEDDTQTAPEAVHRRAADAQERATRLQKLGETIDKLYAALTPDQHRIVDQYLPALIP